MNEYLLGQYDLSRISIDCNSSYANFTVFAHELAHFSLTKNTLFGILHFFVMQVNESYPNAELGNIVGIMTDASERTQETYSMYYELLHVSSQYKRFFKSYYYNFKQGAYYSKYQFRDFEWSIGNEGFNDDAKLIDRFATISMNVDITKFVGINPWKASKKLFDIIFENKSCYMPDFRLGKLLKLIHAVGISELHKMSDSEIAITAGIEYLDFTTETVLALLKRLSGHFDETGYSSKLINANIENIETNHIKLGYYLPKDEDFCNLLKQTILPECLNHKFNEVSLSVLPDKSRYDIELITLYDYNPVCLCEFTDFKKTHKYSAISETVSVTEYLKDYYNTVQFYFDDYHTALQNWPSLTGRRVFFSLKNPYYEFKKLIADYISNERYAFICKLNDGVFILFVLDKANNIFYTCQSMMNLDVVIADFKSDFYTVQDDKFWTEDGKWRDYIRILAYFSEKNITDATSDEFVARMMSSAIGIDLN